MHFTNDINTQPCEPYLSDNTIGTCLASHLKQYAVGAMIDNELNL